MIYTPTQECNYYIKTTKPKDLNTLFSIKNMAKIQFKGEPVIQSPAYSQMKWDGLGKQVIREVNAQFRGTPAEISPEYKGENDQVTHSNIFRISAINSVARKYGARVILPETSEVLLAQGRLPEAGSVYYDLGTVLDFSGKNHDVAIDFYNKLPKEMRDLDKFPAVALELAPVKSSVGSYGLSLEPSAFTKVRTAKIILQGTGDFDGNDAELFRTGLPSKHSQGNRKIYTFTQNKPSLENLGVVRLCLVRGRYLYCGNGGLAGAFQGGRVALESAEGASQNFSEYALNVRREQESLEARLAKEKENLEARD